MNRKERMFFITQSIQEAHVAMLGDNAIKFRDIYHNMMQADILFIL